MGEGERGMGEGSGGEVCTGMVGIEKEYVRGERVLRRRRERRKGYACLCVTRVHVET